MKEPKTPMVVLSRVLTPSAKQVLHKGPLLALIDALGSALFQRILK